MKYQKALGDPATKSGESKYPNRYLNLITVNFNKYISNYGTDWGRPLFVLFGLGYFFILLYSFFLTSSLF